MQPKIIENFISKEMCIYINDYFLNNVKLDQQGYSNIYVNKYLPFYDDSYLLKTLDKKNSKQALFYDTLNLLQKSIKLQFNFSKDELDSEFFNYRNFGPGQNFKDYHIDDYGNVGKLYTALLYLTDDYEGGEITFYDGGPEEKDKSVTYRPKAGSLFLFEGIDPHSVNPVISGRRALFSMNNRTPGLTEYLTL